MEMTLIKARKLASKVESLIEDEFMKLHPSTEVRVNGDLTSIDLVVDDCKNKMFDNMSKLDDLVHVRQEIRDKVKKKNHECGIDDLISKKLVLENQIKIIGRVFDTLDEKDLLYDKQSVEDSVDYAKRQLESGEYGASTKKKISILRETDMEQAKKSKRDLTKEIESVEDSLSEMNHTEKIELKDESVKLLQEKFLL